MIHFIHYCSSFPMGCSFLCFLDIHRLYRELSEMSIIFLILFFYFPEGFLSIPRNTNIGVILRVNHLFLSSYVNHVVSIRNLHSF